MLPLLLKKIDGVKSIGRDWFLSIKDKAIIVFLCKDESSEKLAKTW